MCTPKAYRDILNVTIWILPKLTREAFVLVIWSIGIFFAAVAMTIHVVIVAVPILML